jgi:hypothetical protein
MSKFDPLTVFATAFVISSLAGMAALLRSTQELSVRTVLSVILNTGAMGLAISLVLFNYFEDNAYFLFGLCLLAGLGGLTAVGFLIQIFKQGGVEIIFKPKSRGGKNNVD